MIEPRATFVSYSRTDAEFVQRLCRDLSGAGVLVWLDTTNILPGDDWDLSIEKGLRESGQMVVVMSPRSVASDNVLDEVGYALTKGKPVIPVLLEDCEVPYRLHRNQHIDFRSSYDEGFRQLLQAIARAQSPHRAVAPPSPEPQRTSGGQSVLAHKGLLILGLLILVAAALVWKAPRNAGALPDARSVGRAEADKHLTQANAETGSASSPPPAASVPGVGAASSQAAGAPSPQASSQEAQQAPVRTDKRPFKESYRSVLVRFMREAPSGFRALGAQEFLDWTPSVTIPAAKQCVGSGYPRDPVIACVIHRTTSEVDALNKFEDLIELTQSVLPGSKGERMNMFWAAVSQENVPALVLFEVNRTDGKYEVVVSVRPRR